MGHLNRLKEDIAELAGELEAAWEVPDAARQPELTRARAIVEEAQGAVDSAFLSRRAMALAKDAVSRAHGAVEAAREASRLLRERSGMLSTRASEARATASDARHASRRLAALSRGSGEVRGRKGGRVVLDSAIPSEHPRKKAIEEAVHQRLAVHDGDWQVWITVPPGGGWWGLRVRGPAVDWVGTLQDAREQTPEGVLARLEPLVRMAAAEAGYRGGRRGARARGDGPDRV
jgi:hypothetical protein